MSRPLGFKLYTFPVFVCSISDALLESLRGTHVNNPVEPCAFYACLCECVKTRETKTAPSALETQLLPLEMSLSFYVQRHLRATAQLFLKCEEGTVLCEGM